MCYFLCVVVDRVVFGSLLVVLVISCVMVVVLLIVLIDSSVKWVRKSDVLVLLIWVIVWYRVV